MASSRFLPPKGFAIYLSLPTTDLKQILCTTPKKPGAVENWVQMFLSQKRTILYHFLGFIVLEGKCNPWISGRSIVIIGYMGQDLCSFGKAGMIKRSQHGFVQRWLSLQSVFSGGNQGDWWREGGRCFNMEFNKVLHGRLAKKVKTQGIRSMLTKLFPKLTGW